MGPARRRDCLNLARRACTCAQRRPPSRGQTSTVRREPRLFAGIGFSHAENVADRAMRRVPNDHETSGEPTMVLDYAVATWSRPRFRDRGADRTTISTSRPSAVRNSISRCVEKPPKRPCRICETFG